VTEIIGRTESTEKPHMMLFASSSEIDDGFWVGCYTEGSRDHLILMAKALLAELDRELIPTVTTEPLVRIQTFTGRAPRDDGEDYTLTFFIHPSLYKDGEAPDSSERLQRWIIERMELTPSPNIPYPGRLKRKVTPTAD
jgi:hypothetical protein